MRLCTWAAPPPGRTHALQQHSRVKSHDKRSPNRDVTESTASVGTRTLTPAASESAARRARSASSIEACASLSSLRVRSCACVCSSMWPRAACTPVATAARAAESESVKRGQRCCHARCAAAECATSCKHASTCSRPGCRLAAPGNVVLCRRQQNDCRRHCRRETLPGARRTSASASAAITTSQARSPCACSRASVPLRAGDALRERTIAAPSPPAAAVRTSCAASVHSARSAVARSCDANASARPPVAASSASSARRCCSACSCRSRLSTSSCRCHALR